MRISPLAVLILVLVGVAVTAGAAFGVYTTVRRIVIESPVELPPPPQVNAPRPTAIPVIGVPTLTPSPVSSGGTPRTPLIQGTPDSVPTALPTWSDPKRVTILLLGIDQRPNEQGPFRTDTMIVLSLDPVAKTAAMLSIPRDVYVSIPGYGANRVNAANYLGDLNEYPGGGPALAVKTVEGLLGISIQKYVLVNFKAFTTIVEALGPIQVCPAERIFDDQYPDSETYGVITVEFQPVCQELDSVRLLQYARVRHNAGDDIGRAQRQQEVIRAVKDKALSLGGVTALVGKAGDLWTALADNLHTNLTFDELVQLASVGQEVREIKSAVLTIRTTSGGQLLPSTLQNGDQVMSPVYEAVYELVGTLFAPGQGAPQNPQASEENAVLFVANGAGIDGLAGRTAERLRALGFNVADVGNAEGVGLYGKSEIRVYGDKFKTARYLAAQLGLENTIIVPATDGPPGIDIMLIAGADLAQ